MTPWAHLDGLFFSSHYQVLDQRIQESESTLFERVSVAKVAHKSVFEPIGQLWVLMILFSFQ